MKKTVIDAIIINDKKELLVVNKNGKWILPWGKSELGETHEDTLERELFEEIGVNIDPDSDLQLFRTFRWTTPFSKRQVKVSAYLVDILSEKFVFKSEICDCRFWNKEELAKLQLSEITADIVEALYWAGLID